MFKTIIIIFSIIIIFIIQPIVTNDIIIEEDAITSGRVVSSVSDDPSTYNYVNACNLISSPNSNPNIYDNFRRIQSYIEIVEPTDLWTAEAYLRYIVQNCSFIVNNKTIFNKVIQIDTYGNPYLHGFAIDDQSPVHVSALAMRFGAFIGKISNMIFNNHKYNDDIQTAKHLAHVKDLGRVAAIREMSIEKDKFISELKLNKDIHSILTFALNTCEQTLNEVQPHVVTKLQEGRNKRLKALEQAHRQQKKDLDQRSMDTCLVSTAHLEGFVMKAEKKHKESTDKAANALRKLRDLLDLSVARNNDTNDVNNEEEKLGDRGKEEALKEGKEIVE